jgi:NitT/TauT family transport system substrate-binding protein
MWMRAASRNRSGMGTFPNDGGGLQATLEDFNFYGFAGTLEGDISKLKVEDYWDLEPLKRALAKIRQQQ